MTDKTYKLDIEKEKISGFVDGKEAIKQFIYTALSTERYENMIYSDDFGVELYDLYGKSKDYALSVIEERVREALIYDERIDEIQDFEAEETKNGIKIKFIAISKMGEFEIEKEVSLDV